MCSDCGTVVFLVIELIGASVIDEVIAMFGGTVALANGLCIGLGVLSLAMLGYDIYELSQMTKEYKAFHMVVAEELIDPFNTLVGHFEGIVRNGELDAATKTVMETTQEIVKNKLLNYMAVMEKSEENFRKRRNWCLLQGALMLLGGIALTLTAIFVPPLAVCAAVGAGMCYAGAVGEFAIAARYHHLAKDAAERVDAVGQLRKDITNFVTLDAAAQQLLLAELKEVQKELQDAVKKAKRIAPAGKVRFS